MGRASPGRAAAAGRRRAVCAGSCRLVVGPPADERGATIKRIACTLSFTDLGAEKKSAMGSRRRGANGQCFTRARRRRWTSSRGLRWQLQTGRRHRSCPGAQSPRRATPSPRSWGRLSRVRARACVTCRRIVGQLIHGQGRIGLQRDAGSESNTPSKTPDDPAAPLVCSAGGCSGVPPVRTAK